MDVQPRGKPEIAFAMGSDELRTQLFPAELMGRLSSAASVLDERVLTEFGSERARRILRAADALITGWGCPPIDAAVLDRAPRLQLIAHAGGTVKAHVDRECWSRGIAVTTAAQANARPVAELSLGFILLAGKQAFVAAAALARQQGSFTPGALPRAVGNYGTTVGIIGASRVGRALLDLLRPFRFTVLVADPELTARQAAALGARLVPLDELMAGSRIVSLHAPLLPATIGMIGREQLSALPDGAVFINTARGALVDHAALRNEVRGGRIGAILDVTDPEPLPTGDPLYAMPNVVLTPHIAGSLGNELVGLGAAAAEEVERLAAGRPYAFPVGLAELAGMA